MVGWAAAARGDRGARVRSSRLEVPFTPSGVGRIASRGDRGRHGARRLGPGGRADHRGRPSRSRRRILGRLGDRAGPQGTGSAGHGVADRIAPAGHRGRSGRRGGGLDAPSRTGLAAGRDARLAARGAIRRDAAAGPGGRDSRASRTARRAGDDDGPLASWDVEPGGPIGRPGGRARRRPESAFDPGGCGGDLRRRPAALWMAARGRGQSARNTVGVRGRAAQRCFSAAGPGHRGAVPGPMDWRIPAVGLAGGDEPGTGIALRQMGRCPPDCPGPARAGRSAGRGSVPGFGAGDRPDPGQPRRARGRGLAPTPPPEWDGDRTA